MFVFLVYGFSFGIFFEYFKPSCFKCFKPFTGAYFERLVFKVLLIKMFDNPSCMKWNSNTVLI